ncbi:MAG: hypothetical protein ACLFOY_15065 [Desulfatibacillaceae bacterium]
MGETAFDRELADAVDAVRDFVEKTTGEALTDGELGRALRRYFVLNEIKEHVLLEREGE